MDESWRMRMGIPAVPSRRSMEDRAAGTTRRSMESLDPTDFADVFGGPPRTVLSRKFSGEFTRSSPVFYEEIFRKPEFVSSSIETKISGRSLPAFRIPETSDEFYSDVFGWEDGRRSRDRSRPNSKAKSKSNSSSVLSSEELSPHWRPVAGDDAALSSFTSKLRPINVPSKWNSTEPVSNNEDMHYFPFNDYFKSSHIKVSRQVSSPETISLDPTSHRSIKIQVEDLEANSPASPVSSICQEPEPNIGIQRGNRMQESEMEMEDDDDDDEVMSSYVIEISPENREVGSSEAISVDDAIAWAKEKFHSHSSDSSKDNSAQLQERPTNVELREQQNDGMRRTGSSMEEELKKWRSEEETEQSEKDMELELLDEEIQLWSAGKETNIRMLLSTLHHILWANSSWYAAPLTSLIESSQVKKAYQKARLCLHPDKLQQRGATLQQKYIAEKVFSILQDAWAAFISQDVFFN